jgi:hypothetical protein
VTTVERQGYRSACNPTPIARGLDQRVEPLVLAEERFDRRIGVLELPIERDAVLTKLADGFLE